MRTTSALTLTQSLLAASLLCAMSNAVAADARLALLEVATKQTSFYELRLDSGEVALAPDDGGGAALEDSAKYHVQNYKVEDSSGAPIADGIDILCQATLGDHDVVIVRQEYNSANPLYWLAAMSGHPVQVSRIVWLDVKDGKLLHSREIASKPASYHWQASLGLPK